MISINLQGRLSVRDIDMVIEQTRIMFDENTDIKAADSLILHWQNIIPKDLLDSLTEKAYPNYEFYEIKDYWVSPDIIKVFSLSDFVPVKVDYKENVITAAAIPEFMTEEVPLAGTFAVNRVCIKLYEYVSLYIKYYGKNPRFIKNLPASDIFNMIVREAILLKAADITISQKKNHVEVYYNVAKRKVYSKRTIPDNIMEPIVKILTARTNSSPAVSSREPVYFTIDLDESHRGRTVINQTYCGKTITIRVLSNELHKNTFKSLNIPEDVTSFFMRNYVSITPGLKLLAGPTYSGKNTTIITILDELHSYSDVKMVSVENPVEILTDYIEQINAESEKEFRSAVNSTLRQNPDIVYIAEMTASTALETMKIANTGKEVLSTIHVNSIAEIPSRIKHLTDMELSEIIGIIDSMAYQELLPKKCPYCGDKGCELCHKAGVIPVFTYLKITNELRKMLIDKDLSQVYKILDEKTEGKNNIDELYKAGIISEKTYMLRRRD